MVDYKAKKELPRGKKIRWETPKIVKLSKIRDSFGEEDTCYSFGGDPLRRVEI